MIFNVVLLHIGETFDDRRESFREEHPVLFKCFESVKREFKDDNIIVFYSYEEIFEKFPGIKDVIDKKYSKFFYDKDIQENFKTDLIRILLIQYYENMLYIDADIFVDKGLKTNLLKINKHNTELFFVLNIGLSLFFCKNFFNKLNILLKLFEDNTYKGDDNAMKTSNFPKLKEVSYKYQFLLPAYHYPGLSFSRKMKCKSIYYLPVRFDNGFNYIENIGKNMGLYGFFIFQPNGNEQHIIINDSNDKKCSHLILSKNIISIEELLKELNFINLPKMKIEKMIILGITNYLNENIENVNKQIEKIQEKIGEDNLHIFIFHDNNYEQSYHKYENFKNLTLITENKNMGTLYGRMKIINSIPSSFNNEFLVWLDADDEVENIDNLLLSIEKYKNIDYVTYNVYAKSLCYKLVKIALYKKIVATIKLCSNLRVRTAECNIITAALLSFYEKKEISTKMFDKHEFEWFSYCGSHQTFQIERDFYDKSRIDNLKADLEELAQWIIWKEIDKPGFNLNINNCDHFYKENIPKIQKLKTLNQNEIIKKINQLVNSIIKKMPLIYKEAIKKELIIE